MYNATKVIALQPNVRGRTCGTIVGDELAASVLYVQFAADVKQHSGAP